jgi:DNA-binding transcriptional LysR family regulator
VQQAALAHKSGSARTLGYTQPAASHHIARLEEEVGTALMTRLGRGVRLTDAGLAPVERADAVLTRLTAAEEELAAIAGLRAGRVRLAAFRSGSATLLAGAPTRLRASATGATSRASRSCTTSRRRCCTRVKAA